MQANLRRRARAASESAIDDIATAAGLGGDGGGPEESPLGSLSRGRQTSTPAPATVSPRRFFVGAPAAAAAATAARGGLSPVERTRRTRRASSTPPCSRSCSPSVISSSDAGSGTRGAGRRGTIGGAPRGRISAYEGNISLLPREQRTPSDLRSEEWSDCGLGDSWDGLHDPRNAALAAVDAREGEGVGASGFMGGGAMSISPYVSSLSRNGAWGPFVPRWASERLGSLGSSNGGRTNSSSSSGDSSSNYASRYRSDSTTNTNACNTVSPIVLDKAIIDRGGLFGSVGSTAQTAVSPIMIKKADFDADLVTPEETEAAAAGHGEKIQGNVGSPSRVRFEASGGGVGGGHGIREEKVGGNIGTGEKDSDVSTTVTAAVSGFVTVAGDGRLSPEFCTIEPPMVAATPHGQQRAADTIKIAPDHGSPGSE